MNQNSDKMMDIKNIVLRFGGVVAIQNISFDIFKGEIRAIIGPNGAGKSSMLNVINGFYHPQEGEVWFRGQKRKSMKPYQIAHQGIARTSQNIALFKGMTALDNILIGAHRHINYGPVQGLFFSKKARNEEEKARKIAEDVIDFLEIEEYRYSYILSLPYGIQKRIELGRALAMQPKVILLDEPAAGMNNEETEDIARFILDIHEELGITVILIDHDMNMVMDIASEVVAMDFGEKLFQGLPEDAAKDQKVVDAYLGVSG